MPFFPPSLPFRRGEAERCNGVRQGTGHDAGVGGMRAARLLTCSRPGEAGRGQAEAGVPLWEVRPDVLQPDHGLRPTGVPALCRAAVVPDEPEGRAGPRSNGRCEPCAPATDEGPSVVASGAVEACELVILVAASHVLVVVGGEFWAGDPFLRAVLVAAVHPLDLPRVVAAREKVDAPLVHPHHCGEVVPALELDEPPLRQTAHD